MGGLTTEPERLSPEHALQTFRSGEGALDDWLKRRALHNEREGASRTYVVCAEGRVVGYYSLATGAVTGAAVPGRVRRNMPEPIPVMVLGRLAVDLAWQGRKVGRSLLSDAIRRTLSAADVAGIRALLVHALSPDAKRFYERYGFQECPEQPMTLVLMLRDARATPWVAVHLWGAAAPQPFPKRPGAARRHFPHCQTRGGSPSTSMRSDVCPFGRS